MTNLKQTALKGIFKGLGVVDIVKLVIKTLNIHWSDTDEGTEEFDPLPNPKRFLVMNPGWLPKMLQRHVDCGEAGTHV